LAEAGTNTKKLLLSDSLGTEARALLATRDDITPVYFPHLIPNDEFLERVKAEAPVAAWVLGATRITPTEIEAAQGLVLTARMGVGYDAIDVPAHTERGLPVMTAGLGNAPSVAEHAVHMMLTLVKKAPALDKLVRDGDWVKRMTIAPGDLLGKTVLVIGFGRIGTRTAKRCLAMEMDVAVYDPYVDARAIEAAGCRAVSDLDGAIPAADFITIHCPKTPETLSLFNEARLGRMKPTAYLVNTARGGLIDEDALLAALKSGAIAGAGLDVVAEEPASADHPLFALDNVVVSPHMAGVTREAVDRMSVIAIQNILSVFDGVPIKENCINPGVFDAG